MDDLQSSEIQRMLRRTWDIYSVLGNQVIKKGGREQWYNEDIILCD